MKPSSFLQILLLLGPVAQLACSPASKDEVPAPTTAMTVVDQETRVDLSEIAKLRIDSVVNISSEKVVRTPGSSQASPFFDDPFFRQFFGVPGQRHVPRERRERSLGSGVIVSDDGIVLTNTHVVEGATSISLTLADGREFDASIVGADPKSDVAVLQIEGDADDLAPIPLGDSSEIRLAETVLAIGNPFGLGHTVTKGIISAIGRSDVGIAEYEDFIQTDAAINPGNSGGALINAEGELIGINTAILSRTGGYQGIGFAVPIELARTVMDSLIEHGEVVRGWLGVSIQDITPGLAEAMDLAVTRGALVAEVIEDSPAEEAGIERGDIVISFDGEEIDSSARLRNLVAASEIDQPIAVEVTRGGRERELTVKIARLRDDEGKSTSASGPLLGLSLGDIDRRDRRALRIPKSVKGALVVGVEPGSPAQRAGIRPNDVIREVNRQPIRSAAELTLTLKALRGRSLVLVYRDGRHTYTALGD